MRWVAMAFSPHESALQTLPVCRGGVVLLIVYFHLIVTIPDNLSGLTNLFSSVWYLTTFSTCSQALCKSVNVISTIGDLISDYRHCCVILLKVFL